MSEKKSQFTKGKFLKYTQQHNLYALFSDLLSKCFENNVEDPRAFIVQSLSECHNDENQKLRQEMERLQAKEKKLIQKIQTLKRKRVESLMTKKDQPDDEKPEKKPSKDCLITPSEIV